MPCMVAIAPIIQNSRMGIVRGVFKVIFFLIRNIDQTASTNNTKKSSTLTYTHVFLTSRRGSLGYSGIKIRRKRVKKNNTFFPKKFSNFI